jgi:dihydrofolate synthase/folylpolyglutamate synthase
MRVQTFQEAEKYILDYIPKTGSTAFPGELGWERTRYIMQQLGNPQEQIKIIHIAGTSGKGSVSTILHALLTDLGFKTGLTISPHLLTVRERIQINKHMISEEEFVRYLQQIQPVIEAVRSTRYGQPTYFDVIIALAFTAFADKQVDYAVVETGLGGLLDGTNVVDNPLKVALLSTIGYDHMHILGSTLTEIAYQKAHIMRSGNQAFSVPQEPEVAEVFTRIAQEKGASLSFLTEGENYIVKDETTDGVLFDYAYGPIAMNDLVVGLSGRYQAQNAALALTGLAYLSQRDRFETPENVIRTALRTVTFAGRFETLQYRNALLLTDGAHNPQKMEAFLKSLATLYPDKRFPFLLAFKQGKDIQEMLRLISSHASEVVISRFTNTTNDMIHTSSEVEDVAAAARAAGIQQVSVVPDLKEALNSLVAAHPTVVITGSLYLLGEVYKLINKNWT